MSAQLPLDDQFLNRRRSDVEIAGCLGDVANGPTTVIVDAACPPVGRRHRDVFGFALFSLVEAVLRRAR